MVEGDGPSLFGRDWLAKVRLDWHSVFSITQDKLNTMLTKFDGLFQEGLGTLKGYQAKIQVPPGSVCHSSTGGTGTRSSKERRYN